MAGERRSRRRGGAESCLYTSGYRDHVAETVIKKFDIDKIKNINTNIISLKYLSLCLGN